MNYNKRILSLLFFILILIIIVLFALGNGDLNNNLNGIAFILLVMLPILIILILLNNNKITNNDNSRISKNLDTFQLQKAKYKTRFFGRIFYKSKDKKTKSDIILDEAHEKGKRIHKELTSTNETFLVWIPEKNKFIIVDKVPKDRINANLDTTKVLLPKSPVTPKILSNKELKLRYQPT